MLIRSGDLAKLSEMRERQMHACSTNCTHPRPHPFQSEIRTTDRVVSVKYSIAHYLETLQTQERSDKKYAKVHSEWWRLCFPVVRIGT
jgi:hypothetical protein